MDILINDRKIYYTLENERFLREVIQGIQTWLMASHFVITSVKADSQDVTELTDNERDKTPLEGIQLLEIGAQLPEELLHSNLETIVTCLELLEQAIDNQENSQLDGLKDAYPYLLSSLKVSGLAGKKDDDFDLLSGLGSPSDVGEISDDVLSAVGRMKEKAIGALRDLHSPRDLVQSIIGRLSTSSAEIAEVSLLLQTGGDQEAMNRIVRFSDLCDTILRFLSLISHSRRISLEELNIGEQKIEDFFTSLNDTLLELLSAFQNQDSVLIGDLLEYEVAPRLDRLVAFFQSVRTLIA